MFSYVSLLSLVAQIALSSQSCTTEDQIEETIVWFSTRPFPGEGLDNLDNYTQWYGLMSRNLIGRSQMLNAGSRSRRLGLVTLCLAMGGTNGTHLDIIVGGRVPSVRRKLVIKFDSAEMFQSPLLSSLWVCGLFQ